MCIQIGEGEGGGGTEMWALFYAFLSTIKCGIKNTATVSLSLKIHESDKIFARDCYKRV